RFARSGSSRRRRRPWRSRTYWRRWQSIQLRERNQPPLQPDLHSERTQPAEQRELRAAHGQSRIADLRPTERLGWAAVLVRLGQPAHRFADAVFVLGRWHNAE